MLLLQEIGSNTKLQAIENERCRRNIVYWFNTWVWTYDPRLAAQKKPAMVPMDLFPRQEEMIHFLEQRVSDQEDGLIEKSRDIGFTWVSGGFALHHWLYVPGFKTSFGSRKAELVDRIGDPDSIFEKIRMMFRGLPYWMRPAGFVGDKHDNSMRFLHPTNGNSIRGEAGDDMGRGGRSTLYIIDEAAHVERADSVEAATSANADVRIWASSVQGMGNLFARKRHGGSMRPDQIFRFHWSDDPRKTQEWAAKKKASMDEHVWAAEYDIDYSASVEGICISGKWVEASVELTKMLRDVVPDINGIGGLDVGAGGKAKSVFCARFGPVVLPPQSWGNPDTTETANIALDYSADIKILRSDGYECTVKVLNYDSPGVGKGVQGALNHTQREGLRTVPINTGVAPSETMWPDGQTSIDKFVNLRAEIWWIARERFKASYEHWLFLTGQENGAEHPINELILLPVPTTADSQALMSQISLLKWHKNDKGKILIESKDKLKERGIASPDHADAFMLTLIYDDILEIWTRL